VLFGFNFLPSFRCFILAVVLLVGGTCVSARNDIRWDYINLPASGSVGQTIYFSASVVNLGDGWGGNHYLELSDEAGERLNFLALGITARGNSRTAAFTLQLPAVPGTYTYHFIALEHGREYFGASLRRTIVVRRPLEVTLTLNDSEIVVGEQAVVRSAAGRDERLTAHGVEARVLGGRWQRWAQWTNDRGAEQVAFPQPASSGVYEVRAFAVREGEEPAYSPRATLTVNAIAPNIHRQPAGAIVTAGESVILEVLASGTDPVFQWRKDGVDLLGASRGTLALSPAHAAQSGSYTVTVTNSGGSVVSRAAAVIVAAGSLPAVAVEVSHFPASGPRRLVSLTTAHVGDVVSLRSVANVTAGAGWRHNVLVRRPGISPSTAWVPADGSGLSNEAEAWNKDGWGSPHTDGNSYNVNVTGFPAADLGNREPFIHTLTAGQSGSARAMDFVLDAPGAWMVRAEVLDGAGQTIAVSPVTTVTVSNAALAGDPSNITYPYGRDDKFVGVFWNAGQAHRLWSTWRAEHQGAYPGTWATNWKLMWQPSPYFRRVDGGWLKPEPLTDSPWQPFWSAHQVYAMIPDGSGGSTLTHDLTSLAFAEKAAVRLMDIGVDFVAVDYSNQFLEAREDVFPAVNHLALAFQSVAQRSQSGQRIKLTAVVPANVASGDWAGNGGFVPVAIARFNAKLTTLYERFAHSEAAWFHLEDDNGARKPLLLLWVGAGGEGEPDGKLGPAFLDRLRLSDGRLMTDVFTIRWVGAYLSGNRRFITGQNYSVASAGGTVSGSYANAKLWSYHEHFPSAASLMRGATGAAPAVEAITVQPLAVGRDRFGRVWNQNWPAGQGYHYETPSSTQPVPLANYGRIWAETLAAAVTLNPKFLLTTWAEFGSENDEPRPEMSVTIMDNNKFGTHFGDVFKETVRRFKYRAPTGWIDTFKVDQTVHTISDVSANSLVIARDQIVQLQGWVTPNVAAGFAGGRVGVYIDDQLRGIATVGGAWNGATRWIYDLSGASLGAGRHTVKFLFDDGMGGTSLAGVRFRGETARSALIVEVF
jgi:hypothetical protein